MSTVVEPLVGSVAPSPAGPLDDTEAHLPPPPAIPLAGWRQTVQFSVRQVEFVFRWQRRLGDVFKSEAQVIAGGPTFTCHPDHVRSLFTAPPSQVPSLTAESPLLPIVGPKSVLTANGPRHLRQRRILLPPFHGEAIERYRQVIATAVEREIATWPVGTPFSLGPAMQAITLDVIMGGIFGIEGEPPSGTPEHRLREVIRHLNQMSTRPVAQVSELVNLRREEPVFLLKSAIRLLDGATYPLITQARERAAHGDARQDVLSLLLEARTEDGEPLTDRELRDELLTLVLAGFETTASSLSWTWERLVRTPDALERLTAAVREDAGDAADVVEATIVEGMRVRPVIPVIGRRPVVPWRLGDFAVPAGAPISMSILLLHHREDLYPQPFAFRPERWLGRKPGTYEWIPFGGGTRRCLGAALAMAEQREVLHAMARCLDLEAADPAPEKALHRNVTMIPAHGARVVLRGRRSA